MLSKLLDLALVVGYLATSTWVFIDATVLGIKAVPNKPGWRKGFLDCGPTGFFVVCVLLWIVGFPAYLVRRRRHLAVVSSRQLPGGVNCPTCGINLSLSPDLYGRSLICPSCQGQFTAPRPCRQSSYHGPGPAVVGWVVYPVLLLCSAVELTQGGLELFLEAA
jgi:hypothetical protein